MIITKTKSADKIALELETLAKRLLKIAKDLRGGE